MNSLINKTLQGIRWNFQSQISTSVINFLVGIILMRLLIPEDFGKFTMVYVIFSLIHIFRDVGFSQALIQKKQLTEDHKSSAFWFQLVLGSILMVALINASGWINALYGTSDLQNISFWLALDLLIGAIGLVPIALLRKALNFKMLFRIQMIALFASAIIGIGMAYSGWGYYSLVGKIISWTAINSLGALFMVSWRPILKFSTKAFKELLNFGIPVTGNHLLSFLTRNTDDFFIGHVIGASALGWYNRAYALMMLPIGNITSVLQNVLLSTWSKMQEDKPAIKEMYLQVTGMISLFSFPLMLLLGVLAEPIIEIVFGEKWIPMTSTFQILCIIGMLQSVTALVGMLFMVFDQNKLLFKINMASSIFTISLVIWSVYTFKSIEITAAVYGLTSLILIYPIYFFAGRIINSSFQELIKPIIPPFYCSLALAICAWSLFNFLPISIIWIKLLLAGIGGILLYVLLSRNFNIGAYHSFKQAITQFKNANNE